ncbi:MAG: SufD family Fe-S cluster assembly protein [Candidatus Andersenbacteria bacterium]
MPLTFSNRAPVAASWQYLQNRARRQLPSNTQAAARYGTAFHVTPPYRDVREIPLEKFVFQPATGVYLETRDQERLLSWARSDAYLNWQLAHSDHQAPVVWYVPAGTRQEVVALATKSATGFVSQLQWIVLGAGAELNLVESVAGQQFGVRRLFVQQAAGSVFTYWALQAHNDFLNAKLRVELVGDDARVAIHHLMMGGGTTQADIAVTVHHHGQRTQAQVKARAAATGRALALYRGLLKVGPHATATQGYQHGKALLLSPQAVIDVLPELAITTNDVRCSHGVTVMHLDDMSLWYLRSRGLPEDQARALAITGFFNHDLQIPSVLKSRLEDALASLVR